MDSSMTELRREARHDPEAQRRLEHMQERMSIDPFEHLIDETCLFVGVRLHYRGILRGFAYRWGKPYALFHPLYEIDSFRNNEIKREVPRKTSLEAPGVVPMETCLDLSLVQDHWTKD